MSTLVLAEQQAREAVVAASCSSLPLLLSKSVGSSACRKVAVFSLKVSFLVMMQTEYLQREYFGVEDGGAGRRQGCQGWLLYE
jgi:hypothetical protein